MNPIHYTVANPLATTINDAENIIAQLRTASDELAYAIAEAATWQSRCREAQDLYDAAETEHLAEVILLAQVKEGPLAGIATSSKAYDLVLTNLKNSLRHPSGQLATLWRNVDTVRRNTDSAKVQLEQAQTRFTALRRVAELKANILKASTI